jgi:nitrate reductase gamma subunit
MWCHNDVYMRTLIYKALFPLGILLICISPFMLYFAPVWFGKFLCRPEDYTTQQITIGACADVYIPFAIGVSVVVLIAGCLITALANRLMLESLKK